MLDIIPSVQTLRNDFKNGGKYFTGNLVVSFRIVISFLFLFNSSFPLDFLFYYISLFIIQNKIGMTVISP